MLDHFSVATGSVALEAGLTVEVDPQPLQGIEDDLDELGLGSLPVGVFDAQQHLAANVTRPQPVEQSGAGATEVQVPRRRWGEADAGLGTVGQATQGPGRRSRGRCQEFVVSAVAPNSARSARIRALAAEFSGRTNGVRPTVLRSVTITTPHSGVV